MDQMVDMDNNTCLLDIIDDPSALHEFFSQGPEAEQVPAADHTDDLDDLQATLWDDDPNFVSPSASDFACESLESTAGFSQSSALSQAVQSSFAPTTPSQSGQLQQVVGVQGTSAGVVQVGSPYQSTTPSPLTQTHGSPQILSQAASPMPPGTSASPLLQLPASSTATTPQQQIFLQPSGAAVRAAQPQQTALQTVQIPAASSPAPSNVLNIGQVVRPVVSGASVQLRPQQVVQAGTAQGGQVSLQGTIIQTSTGSRILIQQPVVPGQPINLANLQGLQIRPQMQATQVVQQGQVIQAAQNNQTLTQGHVQQTQVVQAASTVQQGQLLQTSQNAAQVVQQGQFLQQSQQSTQVLQSHNTQILQSTQQGQVVQQTVQQTPVLQQNVVNPTALQTQPQQGQQAVGNTGGIQIAGNQLPSGVSVVNINGQQILIQRAPGGQNIILRAVPNVIQIQAPAPQVNQVGGQIAGSQPQLLITQPTGQIQQSQLQVPSNQLSSVGQPQVLGNLNVLNDSQNVNINVNILPAQGQGQGSASQALQQLGQNKVQLAGGQVVQAVQSATQTTPIKILPKSNAAGTVQGVNVQQLQQQLVKPAGTNVTGQQQLLNVPVSGQDILSTAAALTDIPLQVQPSTSQATKSKPVINTASSIANQTVVPNTSSTAGTQLQTMKTLKVEPKVQLQTVKVEQKPLVQTIKSETTQNITQTPQQIQTLVKSEPGSSQSAPGSNLFSQQQVSVQSTTVGSASQGLQALAASVGNTTQPGTIHHQPLQPKSSASVTTGIQQISIPAISQGNVVTTMATIQPNGPDVLGSTQNANMSASSVVLSQTARSHPAPNVNIGNMPHLQTLPAKATMLVQNINTGASVTSSIVSTSVSTLSTVASTASSAVTVSSTPTIIPTQVSPQVNISNTAQQQGAVLNRGQPQGIAMGNQNLLQRIHQQIKILLSIPNRTEQQAKMLQQLAAIQKKITSQATVVTTNSENVTTLKLPQPQQQPVASGDQQANVVTIQPQPKTSVTPSLQQVLNSNGTPSSIANTTGTVPTPQLVVASVQPTLPGASKLIFTNTTATSAANPLQGVLSTAGVPSSIQKPNVVTLQPASNTTQLKINPGVSPTKATGLIQLKPILPAQNVIGQATTAVAGTSTVTVSNMGATAGGKLLITQPTQQTGKVQIAQIQLPPGVREKLQQQLAKLPPEQQELFKKHQPQVLLRLQQQLMKQQQGGAPTSGITKIPITVNAATAGVTSVIDSSGAAVKPLVVTSAPQQFIIKRQMGPPQPLTRSQLISQQLMRDQKSATQPDCKNPFKHYRDACQRLLRFHVFQDGDPNYQEMLKEEDDFEDRCQELMDKKEKMFNKFELLTYKEAMRERVTSESVMLEKLFLQEESKTLREEKHLALTDPGSFVPRPSKRTRPSPETEDDEEESEQANASSEATQDDKNIQTPAKVPKYAPTPGMLSPVDSKDDVVAMNPVPVKEEPDVTFIKEEPSAGSDNDKAGRFEAGAYSAHSSGGLKLVFKSSPAHALTPDYKPDSPLDTSGSKSEGLSFNSSNEIVMVKSDSDAVPFEDYTEENEAAKFDGETLGVDFSSTGDVSEDDAAVAGLLSVSGTDNSAELFRSQFASQENDFQGTEPGLPGDYSHGTEAAEPDDYSPETSNDAAHGIDDEVNFMDTGSDFNIKSQQYDNTRSHDEEIGCQSAGSDDDIQLVEPDSSMKLGTVDDAVSAHSAADLPETFGGLNNEMESAINSILSLNDPGEPSDFPDMDEFINSGPANTDDSAPMFASVDNDNGAETADGQDDIEAAVQSILM